MQVVSAQAAAAEPQLSTYLQAIRHHWRAIAALVVVAVVAAVTYSTHVAERYDSEAVLFVTPLSATDDALVSIGLFREPGAGATTSVYALGRLLTTPAVVDAVKVRLGLPDASRADILRKIQVKPAQQSATVTIVGSDASAAGAARIANAFADTIIAQRGELVQRDLADEIKRLRARLPGAGRDESLALQQRLAELGSLVGAGDPTIRVLTRAVPPEHEASAGRFATVLIALIAALLLGVAAAFGLELVQPRLRSDDPALQRLPVLAHVPRARTRRVRQYLNGKGSSTLPSDLWESYRALRASVVRPRKQAILVTSALQGEGKTMTAVNLAIALAASDARVVLVDGDLRRPSVARVFGVSPETGGFADLLFGRAEPRDVLVPAPAYGSQLRLLLPGAERPLDLIEPRRVRALLERLRHECDVVVIDSPALLEFADAIGIARVVDTVIVAVRLGRTGRDTLPDLERRLAQQQIVPAGLVVTGRARSRRGAAVAPPQAVDTSAELAVVPPATDTA
jgi:Mrp family chromosome partitioning ATPase/capsular polysaccharide biosynthesis protein